MYEKVASQTVTAGTGGNSSNYLIAMFAVVYAVIAAELLDINRIPRTFVQRDYLLFEAVFVLTLWFCTFGSLRLQAAFGQRSVAAFLSYGLLNGLLCGIIATIGLLGLSVVVKGATPVGGYLSSWQGMADFAWAATVISCGWLIGGISGATCFLVATRRRAWLIGFAVFCIFVRSAVLVSHLRHHQPLW
jgi:hypothetical protein